MYFICPRLAHRAMLVPLDGHLRRRKIYLLDQRYWPGWLGCVRACPCRASSNPNSGFLVLLGPLGQPGQLGPFVLVVVIRTR